MALAPYLQTMIGRQVGQNKVVMLKLFKGKEFGEEPGSFF